MNKYRWNDTCAERVATVTFGRIAYDKCHILHTMHVMHVHGVHFVGANSLVAAAFSVSIRT